MAGDAKCSMYLSIFSNQYKSIDFVVFTVNGKYEEIKIKTITFWKDVSIFLEMKSQNNVFRNLYYEIITFVFLCYIRDYFLIFQQVKIR